jgi:hypothetical protein
MLNKISAYILLFSITAFAQQTAPVSISAQNAETLKKLEAQKPPFLPQEPLVAKERSDAEDEGLKGKVKQITDEREETLKGYNISVKTLARVDYFDQKGNFVQRNFFDALGIPYLIVMYGFIDGKRVSKSKYIEWEGDTSPLLAAPKTKTDEPLKKADSRYQFSFEYKYIDGKLDEERAISSTGELAKRYVYKRTNNQVEHLVYTKDGELEQRSLFTLDKDGNKIEVIFFGLKNYDIYGDAKYRYTYEFDNQGNWIKRTETRERTKNGITSAMQPAVTNRTIIYH